MPTRVGDVLILRTRLSFTIYAVGPVRYDGQQHIEGSFNAAHVRDEGSAVVIAERLVQPGGTIYLRDLDSEESHVQRKHPGESWSVVDR